MSKKRQVEARTYSKLRAAYLLLKPICACWDCTKPATDIHHTKGRTGELYLNTSHWMGLCREHHRYIHDHPAWAREIGYLA